MQEPNKTGTIPTMPDAVQITVSPPVQAFNAGLFISRGRGIHPDRVIDTHELIFVHAGELGMFEDDARFTVRAGEALLLRQGRRHGGTVPYPRGLRFYWIHFRLRPSADDAREGLRLRLPALAPVCRPDRLTELYRQFLEDQATGTQVALAADLLVSLMLAEFAMPRPAAVSPGSAPAVLAARADQYIQARYAESISAAGVAAALRCNPDYLGRIYRRAHGHTLTDAIHRRRHQRARALLLDGDRSIKEVAQVCGFEDAGYFRRLFHAREGLAPARFRQLYAHLHINSE
jgi:AraC-like DNA-binding protein